MDYYSQKYDPRFTGVSAYKHFFKAQIEVILNQIRVENNKRK